MTNEQTPPHAVPVWRRVRPLAAALALIVLAGAGWMIRREVGGGNRLPPVTLIGERVGLMVWRPVAGATVYRLEVLNATHAVTFAANVPDTLAALPPLFESPARGTWWVRAYKARREIARSPKAPMY